MPSQINASNSGFGGIVSTGDSSGVLELQTTGTTAVTIDTSQRVGFVAGTAAAPAITRTGDTNTGIFYPAADTIAFTEGGTESMRLDSNGNVGIGTTSPLAKLHVGVGADTPIVAATTIYASNNGATVITTRDSTNDVESYIGSYSTGTWLGSASNHPAIFTTNNLERMRIDSSGNVLVGTTGTFDLGFGAQRFNSRTTNQSAGFFNITDGTNEPILILANATSTGYTNRMVDMRTNMPTGTGFTAYSYMSNTNTLRFYVRGDGVIFSTSTTISAISDVRHKENIRELDTGLKEVLALQPRRFDWKENQGTNEKDVPGFIAQEVEKVIPELVEDWRNEGEEETYKALKMGNMIPTLVKAIQEQQTIINDLKARIETLEAK